MIFDASDLKIRIPIKLEQILGLKTKQTETETEISSENVAHN